jgi:hypothetical protein
MAVSVKDGEPFVGAGYAIKQRANTAGISHGSRPYGRTNKSSR